jgi:hypothetical protein
MKFLVDECLSPELTKLAHTKGHGEPSNVVWLDRAGPNDLELKPIILDGDWTFLTKNSVDFRGPAERPGTMGQYADIAPCRTCPPQRAAVRTETGSASTPFFQNMPFELTRGIFGPTHGAEFFGSPTSCSVSQCSRAFPLAFIL